MKRLLCLLFLASPLAAQPYYPRHHVYLAVGAGQPRAELAGYFHNSAALSAGYGYRFTRYAQLEGGLDTIFGAARVRDFVGTALGDLRIRDQQYLIPFGIRGLLPLARGRVLLSAGGGGARLQYKELLSQPSDDFHIDCRTCGSRGGWGYYGLVNASVALDALQHFRLGSTFRYFRGNTSGDPVGPLPAIRTSDSWLQVLGEFSFNF